MDIDWPTERIDANRGERRKFCLFACLDSHTVIHINLNRLELYFTSVDN